MAFTANDSMYEYTFLPEAEFKGTAPKSSTLDPFRTADGWLTIAPFTDEQLRRLCDAVGHLEWYDGVENRMERGRGIMRGLAKLFPEQPTAHWLPILEKADIPCGPVHNYDTLLTDPEIVANESFLVYDHPTAGKVRTVNPGARFSETPARMWRTPPKLGEHTEEVLREFGIDRTQVEELRAAKVIN
jgi:crotonobetainyl-CoA:carnitine CoA-transferase CaiB-like acyl-CoA transferase